MRNDPWFALNEDHQDRGNRPGRPLLTTARFAAALLLGLVCLAGAPRAGEDPRDAAVVAALVKQTLEFERTGTDLPWSNPETGSRGVIRVERTYNLDSDTPCRDYTRTTRRPDGERITTRGTGCRMGDGRWFLDEAPGADVAPASKAPPASKTPPAVAGAPAGRKDETAAALSPKAPKAATPAVPARAGEDKAAATGRDKPAGGTAAEARAPAPPPVKPKVLAPDYTLPSRSGPVIAPRNTLLRFPAPSKTNVEGRAASTPLPKNSPILDTNIRVGNVRLYGSCRRSSWNVGLNPFS